MVAEGSVPKRAVDSPAKAFCLEGNPKTLSSTAHRAEQAPAPAREHGHFVRVRMNVSETTAPSETRGPSIAYAMHQRLLRKPQPPPKPGGQALRTQCKEQLDRGPLTTPKPPIAPLLEPPTPAENGGPSETAVRSETGVGSRRECSALAVT